MECEQSGRNNRHLVCESCRSSFLAKDKIIDNLRRDLSNQESKISKLEEEAANQTENLASVLEEKNHLGREVCSLKEELEHMQRIQDGANEAPNTQLNKEKAKQVPAKLEETNATLRVLREQLQGLEEEKKCLNEQIKKFECDTEELSNIFRMQQEKFEQEVANKERVISALENERKLMEKDSKNVRDEMETTRRNNENMKKQIEQLKLSIQEKDAAIVNLSDLHNEALRQTKKLQEELVSSEGCLRKELSNRGVLEEKIETVENEKVTLQDEIAQMKMELGNISTRESDLRAAERRMQKELTSMKEKLENSEKEKEESEKDIVQLEAANSKLTQDTEHTKNLLQKVERSAKELKVEVEKLRNNNYELLEQKNTQEIKVKTLQMDIDSMDQRSAKQDKEILNLRKCLEKTEQNLATKSTEIAEVEQELETLKRITEELKINEKRQRKILETTKGELDLMISTKQTLEEDNEKLKDDNSALKEKIGSLSEGIEKLHAFCDTKTKENDDLANVLNQKARAVASLLEQEEKLQCEIEELLGNEASRGIELKNAKDESVKLQRENATIEEHYQKVNLQLQQCLSLLDEKREEYMAEKRELEQQLQSQTEEAARFREHNTEINTELRDRNDEIISLTMEKQELLKNLEDSRKQMEITSSQQRLLEEEVSQLQQRVEEFDEKERQTMEKYNEVKRQLTKFKRTLEIEKAEKTDVESSLTITIEEVERWKKVSKEYKEERDRLQMQIEDLDRNLNEKYLHFSEEKSSLEKNMESLKSVVARLKTNEETLRNKIEELRNEVDKLSDVKSEQQSQIRKLSHDKERLKNSVADYNKITEERTKLLEENEDMTRENSDLKKEVDKLQMRTRSAEEDNETLKKELEECQNLLEIAQGNARETSRECKELRNESHVLRDCNVEIAEEKQRLYNENCRLKERKNTMLEERNKLQDMIESLDKCHSEKNESLTRKIALLEKELASLRESLKNYEEKETVWMKEIQGMNEKLNDTAKQSAESLAKLKKAECENNRLRKKVGELMKEAELMEIEEDEKIRLEIQLQEHAQRIRKLQEKEKVLNTLVSKLNQQQNQQKSELRHAERDNNELKTKLETERKEKIEYKEKNLKLEEELRKVKCQERDFAEELQNEKDNNQQKTSLISRLEKEKEDCKKLLDTSSAKHKAMIEEKDIERRKVLDKIQRLENDCTHAKHENDELNVQLQARQEDIRLLTAEKVELERNLKGKRDEIIELTNNINTLEKTNQSVRQHAQNLEKIFASKNSAMSDQTSGMEKEIRVLRGTLVQLRDTGATNRKEIEELKRKLEKEKNEKVNAEIQINELRLKRERLEGKNDELLNNCSRLEELVNNGIQLKLEKEENEKNLEAEKQRNKTLQQELEEKAQALVETNCELENHKEEISNYKQSVEKLMNAKEELLTSNTKLTEKNEHILREFKSVNEKYEQIRDEKQHLTELVSFHEEELESLKKDVYGTKADLQQKIHEIESDKCQLQNSLTIKEETLAKMTDKQQKLQDDLRKSKEETEDLEDENEDLLAQLEQSKEDVKKIKESMSVLQTEHSNLQDELREKQNEWSATTEKSALEKFEMETTITNLNEKLAHAQERTEKLRELEKLLRNEIEELSDGYVKLEEEIHRCNNENLSLKEKVQELLQRMEELELARDTACLLKEKRHSELLKLAKNVQRLEKNLKEKQKENKKLMKESDGIIEKQKFLELQLSTEKEISGQRLKQLQDIQNSQRKLEEELSRAKWDKEKLHAEIGTWQLNSESMKLRIETLEEELKNTTTEKGEIAHLYEDSQSEKIICEAEIYKMRINQEQERISYEDKISRITQHKDRLEGDKRDLEEQLRKQKTEMKNLQVLNDDISKNHEDSRLLISVLHNDIKKKDERIVKLEERKRQMINLLADLDTKIAEIQVQAVSLENDNTNLRNELNETICSEEHWKKTAEQQEKMFSERMEVESREKQQLYDMKEHLGKVNLNAENRIQELSIELATLRAEQERTIEKNVLLKKSKKSLQVEVQERKSSTEQLKESLNIERSKTAKVEVEASSLLEECRSLKNELDHNSKAHDESKTELKLAKKKVEEIEDKLEERSLELEKTQGILQMLKAKAKEQQEMFTNTINEQSGILQSKDGTIETLTKENRNLEKIIDSLTSKLFQSETEISRYEKEKNHLKKIVEEKTELLSDLEVSYESVVNMKESLDAEQKKVSAKFKETSKDLTKLEFKHELVLIENENLHSKNEKQAKESIERHNSLLQEKQTLEEELERQATTLTNMKMENEILRQKNENGMITLEELNSSIKDIQQKLHVQRQENELLKKALQQSNIERDNLNEVNQRVRNAVIKLKTMSASNSPLQDRAKPIKSLKQANQSGSPDDENWDRTFSESNQDKQQFEILDRSLETSDEQVESCELERNLSQIETDVRSLLEVVTERENELYHHNLLFESLKSERDRLDIELTKQVKRCEYECQQREEKDKNLMEIKNDIQNLKREKEEITNDLQAKNLNLSKENVEMQEEINFLKENNIGITVQREKIEKQANEMEGQIRLLQENVQVNKSTIASCKKEIGWLENRNEELKTVKEENMKLIREQEEKIKLQSNEVQNRQELWEENLRLLEKLETEFHLYKKEKGEGEVRASQSQRWTTFKNSSSDETFPPRVADLQKRFDKIHDHGASQIQKVQRLEKKLQDIQEQWTICLKEMKECASAKHELEQRYREQQKQLSKAETFHRDAMDQVDELTATLNKTEAKLMETKTTQAEENRRISQELNQMQVELISACEKFNKSILKAKFKEDALESKKKYICELEDDLRSSRGNERSLQIKTAELETKFEILQHANDELQKEMEQSQGKLEAMECDLRNERESKEKEAAEKQASVTQLKLKLEDAERRNSSLKEALAKSDSTMSQLQDEYRTTKGQFKESESRAMAKIEENKNTILHLHQEVSQLKDDIVQLDASRKALTRMNESLEEKISSMENDIEEYRKLLEAAREEKEIVQKNLDETFTMVLDVNGTSSSDVTDQVAKLKRVAELSIEMRKTEEKLKEESKNFQKDLTILQQENRNLHENLRTKTEDCNILNENNIKLKKNVQKLEMELDQMEVRHTNIESKMFQLQESLEAMKENESQQQYQYKVLEKEKEFFENEAAWTEEKIEGCFQKLDHSLNAISQPNSDAKSSILSDSGIDPDSSQLSMMSMQGPLDSGIFSPVSHKSISLPENDKYGAFSKEHLKSLETAVERSVETMSVLDKTLHNKTRLFTEKEKNLLSEMSVLKKSINHKDDIRSVLEKEVQRLDETQKSFQETLKEKNEDLVACRAEICHLKSVLAEKEKLVEMSNLSVQEYKKRQEFLENKLESCQRDVEQEKSERERIENEKQELTLENSFLADEFEVAKQSLMEKETENTKISTELITKQDLLINSEAKIKTIGGFLEQINKCKDQLEEEMNEATRENVELRSMNEFLRNENASKSIEMKEKIQEIKQKDTAIKGVEDMQSKLAKDLNMVSIALNKAKDELNTSLPQAENIESTIQAINHSLGYSPFPSTKEQRSKGKYPKSLFQELLVINNSLNTLLGRCQQYVTERQSLQDEILVKKVLLEKAKEDNAELEECQSQMQDTITNLSEKCSSLESSSRCQEKDLEIIRDEVFLKKKTIAELENVNSSLKSQAQQFQTELTSYIKLAEDLKKDRSGLKEELLNAQNQLSCLNSKCERLETLEEELNEARHTITELKDIHNKSMIEKNDAKLEAEYAQKTLRDLENQQMKEKQILYETKIALKEERDRITTVTKVARMKEKDLDNAKVTLKSKDEVIGQLQEQINEASEQKQEVEKLLMDAKKELLRVSEHNEALSSENLTLRKKFAIMEQTQEQLVREKQAVEENNTKQKTKVSVLVESYHQQKHVNDRLTEENTSLKRESNLNSITIQQLESEKNDIKQSLKSIEEKHQACQKEFLEVRVNNGTKISELENSLLHLESDLSQSQDRKAQLEQIISRKNIEHAQLVDHNMELQVKVETQESNIKNLRNSVDHLSGENDNLKKSLEISSTKNYEARECLEMARQNLLEVKTKLEQSEQENRVLQEKIGSGKEMIQTLRSAMAKSRKQIEELNDNAAEKERILQTTTHDLEFQQTLITELKEDKSSLDDLYHISLAFEKELRKDLDDSKAAIEKMRKENFGLRETNNGHECKIAEQRTTIKSLEESLETITKENVELSTSLSETRRNLQNIKENMQGCCKKITAIHMKARWMQKELCAAGESIKYNENEHEKPEQPSSLKEIPTKEELSSTSCEIDGVRDKLQDLDRTMEQTYLSVKHYVAIQEKSKKDLEKMVSENLALREETNGRESIIKRLEETRDLLEAKCTEHKIHKSQLEKSNYELTGQRDLLDKQVSKLEQSILNEREKTREVSEKFSSLIQNEHNLNERIQELETNLHDVLKMNAELMQSKQEEIGKIENEKLTVLGKLVELEDAYGNVCEEKTKLGNEMQLNNDKVVALQSELDASMEISDLLEKRYLEESENNTTLRMKVESQSNKLLALNNTLKTTFDQVQDMNQKIESLNEEVQFSNDALKRKDEEILRLEEERKKTEDELQESSLQIQYYKELNEEFVTSKQKTEMQLHETAVLLVNSEDLLREKKNAAHILKIEKDNLRQELQTSTTTFKAKIDDLISQLAASKAKEKAAKQEVDSKKETITDLQRKLSAKGRRIEEIEEDARVLTEEFDHFKMNHSCVEAKLEQTLQENDKYHDNNTILKEQVNDLETRIQKECQESLTKITSQKPEIEDLKIQLEKLGETNQNIQGDFQELQGKCNALKEQQEEKQKEFEAVVKEKDKELHDLSLACSKKDETISNESKKLMTEKQENEKLKQNILQLKNDLEESVSNLDHLENKHHEIARETFIAHKMVMKNLKFLKAEADFEMDNSCQTQDPVETIKLLRSSLELLKDHTERLEAESSQAKEQLEKSEENNRRATIEQTRLRQDLGYLKVKLGNIQEECQLLKENLEKSRGSLEVKIIENESLQKNVDQREKTEADLEDKIERMTHENAALKTEVEIIERKRISSEEAVRQVESQLDDATKMITAANKNIIDLQNSNENLEKRNSCLLEDLTSLQKQAKTNEDLLAAYVKNTSQLQHKLAKTEGELLATSKNQKELEKEKVTAQKNLEIGEKQRAALEHELSDVKQRDVELKNENTELKDTKLQLQEEKEKLETDLSGLRRRIDRMESEENEKSMVKTRLQNQLDEVFASLERQQGKLSQALSDKEVLQKQLLEAEKELKILMEDNAVLNQQVYRNHKNIFSSPTADELSQSRSRLSELRRKELVLAQENRFLLEKLQEKSDELRGSKLKEEESKRELERCRDKMRRYLDERDRWEGDVKSVISQMGHRRNVSTTDSDNVNSLFPEKMNNTRRKTNIF